jgi:hypothetical protein
MSEENVKFIDAESYQGKGEEKLTFRMIVLEHLKKIGTYASVEFRGGYWEDRSFVVAGGGAVNTFRTYVPDTRETYSNSVEYLYDLLYPHFDDEMKKAGDKAKKKIDEAYKDNTIIVEKEREDKTREEEKEYDRVFRNLKNRQSFRFFRREINRELFRDLSCFLHRQKYMEGKSFIDET